MFNVDDYLSRIGYSGSRAPTAQTLQELHAAHLLTVPFENLSIHHGQPIVLDMDALFSKIVEKRRGGFCYELNGLFSHLLRELGFDVTLLSAGVFHSSGDAYGPEFDHLTLLISLEERWLADVGFGVGFRQPLRLDESGEQVQGTEAYKLVNDGDFVLLTRCPPGEDWRPAYRFTLTPRTYEEFFDMCKYHSTSAESPFSKHTLVMMDTPDGRIEIMDTTFTQSRSDGTKSERHLDRENYRKVLLERFGVDMRR